MLAGLLINRVVDDASALPYQWTISDARTGAVERTILVSTATSVLSVMPTLSTDRYVALLDSVLPNADEGPHAVQVVDLEAGVLLDVELPLGDVP